SHDKSLIWVTWVRVSPHTGRTHQIRVHLADQGFPVIRDQVYGRRRKGAAKEDDPVESRIAHFPRQALHAETLRLIHPRTQRPQTFTAPWYDDMKGLLKFFNDQCVEKKS
ncbi:MAG: RNA pseudouridine synthase, partial [Deltaproteobacteria bacterium]|nr:RNA pseudouridine synthase [Deltaproteobacteria bacterium]